MQSLKPDGAILTTFALHGGNSVFNKKQPIVYIIFIFKNWSNNLRFMFDYYMLEY